MYLLHVLKHLVKTNYYKILVIKTIWYNTYSTFTTTMYVYMYTSIHVPIGKMKLLMYFRVVQVHGINWIGSKETSLNH